MIEIKWAGKSLNFETAEWSGTAEQASRELAFTLPCNPYDKEFVNDALNLGDIVRMYSDKKLLFLGVITSREKSAEVGTASYVARDYMHYLLRSNGTYKFKNKTPEYIVTKLCKDLGIKTGSIVKTGINIPKLIFVDQSYYDMAVRAFRQAKKVTGKKYMLCMEGAKVSVIQKGKDCGVVLEQGVTITGADYSDTTDNMVNQIRIYNDKNKRLGQVSNANVAQYGTYQSTYVKETGKSAKKAAEQLFVGITKEASVEAIGDIKCISGYGVKIKDKATGLTGTFYITSDTHTFENGVHTMSLELSWNNTQEAGASIENGNGKKTIKNATKCYYFDGSSVYHSSKSCSACKGHEKALKGSTVAAMKKIKLTSGKNKGKRKYKPCSKCWEG